MNVLTRVARALPYGFKRRLRPLRGLYLAALRFRKPIFRIHTPAGDFDWRVDALTSASFLEGRFEPHMVEAFRRFVRPGSVVYDAGAYAGYHTLVCAALGARVYAFEAREENARSAAGQFALNPNLKAVVLPHALSERDGELTFGEHSSGSAARYRFNPEGRNIVRARSIDSLVSSGELPPPSVIKIDVEGHEPEVLRGGLDTFRRHRPVVLCDYHDGRTLAQVKELLEPLGYTVSEGPPVTAVPI